MKITIKKLLEICNGTLISGNLNLEIESFSKDTRTIKKGDCYIGIRGENFDGNNYWNEAKEKGAIACVIDNVTNDMKEQKEFSIIYVENTISALHSLATYVRSTLNIPVIAVTGSVGKTTTKDMIAEVLSQKYKVFKTPGNLNGQIGLPLSILSVKDEDVVVLEMGMNEFGQISKLTQIAQPTIAAITNIGTAHIGNLGSRENILKAKLEILEGMKPNSHLIINNDNDLLSLLNITDYKVHTCGIQNQSEYQAHNIELKNNKNSYKVKYHEKEISINLPTIGEVFVQNSLFAVAIGNMLGLTEEEIKTALENVSLSSNRTEILTLAKNITLINDTYNSNFEAVVSALNILKNYSGKRKIAVLGDILEMNDYKETIHRDIGSLPILNELDIIMLHGESSKFIYDEAINQGISLSRIYYFDKKSELETKILKILKPNDTVLIKASHGMNFKSIVDVLKQEM